MEPRITLIRHGRSAHMVRGWLDAVGIHAWTEDYDAAGLHSEETAPPWLVERVVEGGVLVSSDLPRARESAGLLRVEGPLVASPLLREATMPIPGLRGLRLPLAGWMLLIGLRWLHGSRRGELPDTTTRRRAREAAAWLTELSRDHGAVFAVTHGTFRYELTRALAERGWSRTRARRSNAHWSAWAFVPRDDHSRG